MSGVRLDAGVLYGLLDEHRRSESLSWVDVAGAVGLSPNVFSWLKAGGAPDAHGLVSLLLWLGWAPELQLVTCRAGERR